MSKSRGRGGDRGTLPAAPAATRPKEDAPGTLDDARRVLWAALTRAGRVLRARDHATALRGVHAVSQAATAYARLVEVSELEARIRALEGENETGH